MKYLKLFEEFKGNRIKVTSDERKRLREISRIIIKHCQNFYYSATLIDQKRKFFIHSTINDGFSM